MLPTTTDRTIVPARHARSIRLAAGQTVRVVDVAGGQVGDVFAFTADDPGEFHSAAHTRARVDRLFPAIGEPFVTNRRREILTLVADDSPGLHDMLIPACDPTRYALLGVPDHRSCAQNLAEALAEHGLSVAHTPQPINVFMNIPVADGRIEWGAARTRAGDSITFRAELDCLFVVSSCPQDVVGINGAELTDLAIEVVGSAG
ncbi:urea carboxylase-associated family protein [Pseudonocardia zijingensis]|jgi:uncharacterized protein YcgI (DUF1989 family)|uniref:Urea carboxylase-associated family protein n=1 Tax=Pseudonocardia zijingensis TaxID=153376 RepID=A0ABN1N7I9_9PSEU